MAYRTLPGHSVEISWQENPLTDYRFGNDCPISYFHPLLLHGGSVPLTLDLPCDHPWHHGLYFTWKYVNGKNCWEDNRPSEQRGRMTTDELKAEGDAAGCTIRQRVRWHDFGSSVSMDENRTVQVHAPDEFGAYSIDFDMLFRAREQEVLLDRTKQEESLWGGYAGISLRPVRSLADGQWLTSGGETEIGSIHGVPARWCDYSGPLNGGAGLLGGAAVFDHPGKCPASGTGICF